MARNVFFSFQYKPDHWRASQIRNIGIIEGNRPATDNDWESITNGGDKAIEKWINDQLSGRSCTIVLIGATTANRKWIDYEIKKTWDSGKGLVGIYIHNLLDSNGDKSNKGSNVFDGFTIGSDKVKMNSVVKAYNPPYTYSKDVYSYISENIAAWVDEAIKIRNDF